MSVHIRLRTGSATVEEVSDTRWTILGEQLIDANRHIRLSTADIRLPDGVEFTQYVARIPRCATTLVLNDNREVLLMYRHRWIIDQWVWELPGGYVDHKVELHAVAPESSNSGGGTVGPDVASLPA